MSGEFFTRTKSPGNTNGKKTDLTRGDHIGFRVTHIDH